MKRFILTVFLVVSSLCLRGQAAGDFSFRLSLDGGATNVHTGFFDGSFGDVQNVGGFDMGAKLDAGWFFANRFRLGIAAELVGGYTLSDYDGYIYDFGPSLSYYLPLGGSGMFYYVPSVRAYAGKFNVNTLSDAFAGSGYNVISEWVRGAGLDILGFEVMLGDRFSAGLSLWTLEYLSCALGNIDGSSLKFNTVVLDFDTVSFHLVFYL